MENNISANLTGLFINENNDDNGLEEQGNNCFGQNLFNLPLSEIIKVTTNSENATIEDIYKYVKENCSVYPAQDEIPLIKIKNEDFLVSGEKIQIYKKFDDRKFNKCKNSNCENNNAYYCEFCKKNICENCSKNCANNKHILIDLKKISKEAESNKLYMQKFFLEYPNDLKNFSLTPDIILIKAIIENNYNNYFHYQNIKECYNYFKLIEYIYKSDCLRIQYEINKDNKDINNIGNDFKIFGKDFVENYKDKLILIIRGKKSELVETVNINEDIKSLEIILIQKLIDNKKNLINDMSYMFCNCPAKLIEFSTVENRDELDLSKVTNISKMFKNCYYLETVNLSFFYKSNEIKSMDYLFSCCEELIDISLASLNTKFVTKMDRIFNNCTKLKKIKDMENFIKEDNEVESFYEMFKGCSVLEELPNMSNWNKGKAKNFEGMFKGCKALEEFPGLSKWNMSKAISLKEMFKDCSFEKLPDISGWNVKNVKDMRGMFSGCKKLKNLPNLKYLDLSNLEIIDEIFFGCTKLMSNGVIPKIENIFNFINIERISYENVWV